MSLEWTGPAASLRQGQRAGGLHRGPAPGERAEPRRDDAQGDRAAGEPARASSCRSRAPRSTSRTTPTNACGQIGETVAFDKAIGVALDYQRSHPDTLVVVTADHSHTSQIVGEDAERQRPADRLLDQPADQGRPDADAHLRHRRLRRRRARLRWRRRRASSTPARSSRCGARAPARSTCSAPTTTPTCSTRWAANPALAGSGGPSRGRRSDHRVSQARLAPSPIRSSAISRSTPASTTSKFGASFRTTTTCWPPASSCLRRSRRLGLTCSTSGPGPARCRRRSSRVCRRPASRSSTSTPRCSIEARRRLAPFAERVDFREASFLEPLPDADAVVASLALHHVHDLSAKVDLYRSIHDALAPGGVLLNLDAAITDGRAPQRADFRPLGRPHGRAWNDGRRGPWPLRRVGG